MFGFTSFLIGESWNYCYESLVAWGITLCNAKKYFLRQPNKNGQTYSNNLSDVAVCVWPFDTWYLGEVGT